MDVQRLCAANGAEQMLCSDRLPIAGASNLLQHHGYLHLRATVCRPPTPALALPLPDALHSHSPDRPSARPAGQSSDQRDRQRRPQNAGSGSGSSGGRGAAGEQAARLSSLPPLRTGRVPTSGGSEAFSQRRRAAHSLACVCIYVRSCERAQRDAYVFVCVPRCILYGGCVSGGCPCTAVVYLRVYMSNKLGAPYFNTELLIAMVV